MQLDIRTISASEALQDQRLVDEWAALLKTRPHVNSIYASPEWLANIAEFDAAACWFWSMRDEAGTLVGLFPVQQREQELQFSVGNRVLYRKKLISAHVLGSLPYLPESPEVIERFIERLLTDIPQCQAIYLDALPTDHDLYRWIQQKNQRRSKTYGYITDGPRSWHLLKLSGSFDEYLATLSPKARAAFRRKVKLARTSFEGEISVRCVTAPEEVAGFLESAGAISSNSWQYRALGPRVSRDDASLQFYRNLAKHGLLRCYLLTLGNTPCAFVIGFQYNHVFHYNEIGFRQDFSQHSPGTVLLYFIIEDLHQTSLNFKTLNFGVGDATYKQRYGNVAQSDVSALILRKGLRNQWLTASHHSLNTLVASVKKLIGRKVEK